MLNGGLVAGIMGIESASGNFRASQGMVAKDPKALLGLEQLWSVVLAENSEGVHAHGQQLLTFLNSYTCLCDDMKRHRKQVTSNFITACMHRVQAEAEAVVAADSNAPPVAVQQGDVPAVAVERPAGKIDLK